MAVPVLMTLFTDDAVEVRYQDQSCLQLSPCGSTFVHHDSPGQLVHQAHGMKTISQRCQFVTSDYREKVLQALDFRNRFAERPFICQSLMEEDSITHLYARITSAAWPKGLEQANFEYIHDGGVKLISADEYSSLVLSPHKQDFTVCYLCGISLDSPRKKISRHKYRKQEIMTKGGMSNKETKTTCIQQDRIYHHDNIHISDGLVMSNDQLSSKNCEKLDCHRGSPERIEKLKDDLNISPISLASTQMSRESSPINDSKTPFNRYSTPTNLVQNKKTGQTVQKTDCESLDGSFLQFIQKATEPENIENTDCDYTKGHNLSCESKHSSDSDQSVNQRHVHWISKHSSGSDFSETGSVDDQSNSQILYSWVTRHFSCEECPASWNHVLNMARAAIENKEQLETYSSATSVHINQKPRGIPKKINPEKYCMTPFPESLPLTCPGQHLHKQYGKYVYDSGRDIVENIMALSEGKLKIVLIDGIVFRIVRLASTKFIEIFPGDGSVILSEGLGGHFYRHIIPRDFQLDERTYSLKAPPPTPRSAPYSIEKLIKRASRFLLQTNQEDKTITNRLACCWKFKDDTLIEPLPASLIEECSVPGHGRFSAYSNGHVRILFDDRTSLDMACDFTSRIMGCMEHISDAREKVILQQQLEQQSHMDCGGQQGLCKLLLPNGQYQIVDSKQPGVYKKYTDTALEWGAWVNSTPNQRKIFYQNWNIQDDSTIMIAKELQKIKCFNYLVDNALPTTRDTNLFQDNSLVQDHGLKMSEQSGSHSHRDNSYQHQYGSVPRHIISSNSHVSSYQQGLHSNLLNDRPIVAHHRDGRNPLNDRPIVAHHGDGRNPSKELEMMRGFNSVREALLRTSSAIKDIDEIIEKKGVQS